MQKAEYYSRLIGMDGETEIKLRGVTKTYRMGEVDVPVLRGMDIDIRGGKLTVVLGASGSGKSTLLNMIGGIDRPSTGEIIFDDRNIAGFDDAQLTDYRRKSVGFVFQFYNLVPTLTAKENVQVSTEIAPDPMDPAEALERVGLGDHIDYFPSQLSGGQQQRVAIARALAKKPRLLLCDEPTGALDHDTSILVLDLLRNLNSDLGTTTVMITHASPIAGMADRVIHIGNGRVSEMCINENPLSARELDW